MRVYSDSQMLRFIIAGAAAASLYFLASLIFVEVGFGPFWGSLLAYGLAFLAGYGLQRRWTFQARHRHRDSLPRYLLLQLVCALLAAVLAELLVGELHFSATTMAVATTAVVGLTSYLGSRCWVFPAATR